MSDKSVEPEKSAPPQLHTQTSAATLYEPQPTLVDEALDAEANITHVPSKQYDPNQPPPPPNGGTFAWLQVAGSYFLFFNCWGLVNSFGGFQTYYENNAHWQASPSQISWIGSLQSFLLMFVGVLTGPLFDAGYFRCLITVGSVLVPLGFMMTSLCQTYWQTILAQGIMVGLGNGCLFVPSVAILPQYFSTRKALANGIAASGSSMGGLLYPIIFRQLLDRVGFAWTTRIMAFIALGTLSFSVAVLRQRLSPKEKRSLIQLSAFQEPPYALFAVAMVFAFIGFYGPIFYIQSFALDRGIVDENMAFYLLPILNAASIPGRIVPNFISDYSGPLNVVTVASVTTAIMAFAWIGVRNLGGIVAFAVLYGFCSGAFVSLPPVAIVTLTKDMRTLGTRMGQVFFLGSFGLLIGAPISGAIYSATGEYLGLQLFSGVTLLVCGALIVAARVAAVGWKPLIKA